MKSYKIESGMFRFFVDCASTVLQDTEIKVDFTEEQCIAIGWSESHNQLVKLIIPREQFLEYGEPGSFITDFNWLQKYVNRMKSVSIEIQIEENVVKLIGYPSKKEFSIYQVDKLFGDTPHLPKPFTTVSFGISGSTFTEIIEDCHSLDDNWVSIPFMATAEMLKIKAESDQAKYQRTLTLDELRDYAFSAEKPSITRIRTCYLIRIAKLNFESFDISFENDAPMWIRGVESGIQAMWITAPEVERD
jgi:hypothetical protein